MMSHLSAFSPATMQGAYPKKTETIPPFFVQLEFYLLSIISPMMVIGDPKTAMDTFCSILQPHLGNTCVDQVSKILLKNSNLK